jgi:hypothetical protein
VCVYCQQPAKKMAIFARAYWQVDKRLQKSKLPSAKIKLPVLLLTFSYEYFLNLNEGKLEL